MYYNLFKKAAMYIKKHDNNKNGCLTHKTFVSLLKHFAGNLFIYLSGGGV